MHPDRYAVIFRSVRIAVLIALLARLASIWVTSEFEIYTEGHSRVSLFLEGTAGDYLFYKGFSSDANLAFSRTIEGLFSYLSGHDDGVIRGYRPGPALPALIEFFDYRQGNTLPLSLTLALAGFLLCCGWIIWLNGKGISNGWLVIFAVLPTPIWYSLIVQTDLIYACAIFFFYLLASQENLRNDSRLLLNSGTMIACLLIRPNALSLYPVFLIDLFHNRKNVHKAVLAILIISFLLTLLYFSAYYARYFLIYMRASTGFTYFGIGQEDYLQGLFPFFASPLDRLLSWAYLLIVKVLYLSGLRPSYSGVDWYFVLLRAAPGLITFPGVIYLFLRGAKLDKIFCAFFMFPFIIGVAQERYLLPILPILFYYGVLGLGSARQRCVAMFSTPAQAARNISSNPGNE
jgi:hypothetical protein